MADDVIELVAPPEFLLQRPVLVAQSAHFERLLDDGRQMVERKGLQQKVSGPALHGLDGILDGAKGRHHNHRRRGIDLPRMRQHLHAIHLRQLQVGQDQVRPVHKAQPRFAGSSQVQVITGTGELQLEHPAKLVFVLNHEYAFLGHA